MGSRRETFSIIKEVTVRPTGVEVGSQAAGAAARQKNLTGAGQPELEEGAEERKG
jgi:hypothetical protein